MAAPYATTFLEKYFPKMEHCKANEAGCHRHTFRTRPCRLPCTLMISVRQSRWQIDSKGNWVCNESAQQKMLADQSAQCITNVEVLLFLLLFLLPNIFGKSDAIIAWSIILSDYVQMGYYIISNRVLNHKKAINVADSSPFCNSFASAHLYSSNLCPSYLLQRKIRECKNCGNLWNFCVFSDGAVNRAMMAFTHCVYFLLTFGFSWGKINLLDG